MAMLKIAVHLPQTAYSAYLLQGVAIFSLYNILQHRQAWPACLLVVSLVVEHNGRDIDAAPRSIPAIVARSSSLIINWFNRANYHPVHDPSIVHMSRHLRGNGSSPSRQHLYPISYLPPPSLHQPIGQLLSNYTCNNLDVGGGDAAATNTKLPSASVDQVSNYPSSSWMWILLQLSYILDLNYMLWK